MEVNIVPRARAWKGPGRPLEPVSEEIMALVSQVKGTGNVGSISLAGVSRADLKALLSDLRRGAAHLGCRLRTQEDGKNLRFEVVPDTRRKP